jgi:AraC-like DNA-binding protein
MQRIGLLTEVPSLLRQLGVRPASVLRKVALTAHALADREAQIPYASALSLLAECARATGCEHFGLLAGSQWRLEHLGLPGEIARSSATIGQAIEQFTTWHWMNTTGGVAFLSRDSTITGFGYAIFEPGATEGTFQIYDLVIAIAVGMLRQLSDNAHWKPLGVQISHARPANIGPYRRFFQAPLRFDAEASMIHFPSSFEDFPVRSADEVRHRTLEAKLSALEQENLMPRLYRMVRVAMLFGLTSGDEVAAAMGLRRRTFNRRLEEYGTTFRDALETVRFEAARQLLLDTNLAIGEIGAALGYAESSPFVRAFQRWSGHSPNAWRLHMKPARRRSVRHVRR